MTRLLAFWDIYNDSLVKITLQEIIVTLSSNNPFPRAVRVLIMLISDFGFKSRSGEDFRRGKNYGVRAILPARRNLRRRETGGEILFSPHPIDEPTKGNLTLLPKNRPPRSARPRRAVFSLPFPFCYNENQLNPERK